MRVFVVGGTGVLGRELVRALLPRGHVVRVLARSPHRAIRVLPTGTEVAAGDLLAPQLWLEPLLEGCDAVVHAATAIPSDPRAPGAWTANRRLRTEGTRRLLGAAHSAGVRRYLQQSIAFAYADAGDRELDEAAPLDPSDLRVDIREMEALVRASPLEFCILRGGLFIGPGTAQEAQIERLRAGAEVVPGEGRAWLPFVHPADLALAFAMALEGAPAGSIYNAAADPVRQGDYLDRLAAALRVPAPRRDPTRPAPPSTRATSRAIARALGWGPLRMLVPPWGIPIA